MIVSKTVLKSYFELNDQPTQAQFVDLIDTLLAGYIPAVGAEMPQPSSPVVYVAASTGALQDVYTVPANRKAYVISSASSNFTGSAISITMHIKIAGSYWQFQATQSKANNSASNGNNFSPIVLHAGESLAINTTAVNLSVWFKVIEFDATSPVKRIDLTTWANGANTLYTCPALTQAEIIASGSVFGFTTSIAFLNFVGSSRVLSAWLIPSGGAATNANKLRDATTMANGTGAATTVNSNLNAGDAIVVSLDIATSQYYAFTNIVERAL